MLLYLNLYIKCTSTTEFDSFHSIYSIEESQSSWFNDSGILVYFRCYHLTHVYSHHSFILWLTWSKNMERSAYPTMRNEIDHQFIFMFYNSVCNFFVSAMTSVNETSIHSTFVQYLYPLHPLKRKKNCAILYVFMISFCHGIWIISTLYHHFKSFRLQAHNFCLVSALITWPTRFVIWIPFKQKKISLLIFRPRIEKKIHSSAYRVDDTISSSLRFDTFITSYLFEFCEK